MIFIDILSGIEVVGAYHNFVATCTPCRKGSCEYIQNLWSSPWWKEAYDQVLCKWKMCLNAGNEEPCSLWCSNIWYYQVLLRLKQKVIREWLYLMRHEPAIAMRSANRLVKCVLSFSGFILWRRRQRYHLCRFLLKLTRSSITKKEGVRSTRGKTRSPGAKTICLTFSTLPFYAWVLAQDQTKQLT